MDFLDDIMRESDTEINENFLNTLTSSLPAYQFSILLDSGTHLFQAGGRFETSPALEHTLREAADSQPPPVMSPEFQGTALCPIRLKGMNSIAVCRLPAHLDPATAGIMIREAVDLCLELFHRDRQLASEKALLLAHKAQRDGKIQVLEKKYQDILTRNQTQSAEYSKLLRSEIRRRTSELKNPTRPWPWQRNGQRQPTLPRTSFWPI